MDIVNDSKPKFDKVIEHLKEELLSLRTGRANSALVENVSVLAYGTTTKLKQLANISVPDARTIVIEPWDKSIIKDVEKSLVASDLGFNPSNEGNFLRIHVPQMTEEDRREYVKIVGQKAEHAKIAVRQVRDDMKDMVGKLEEDGGVSEDDTFRMLKNLDEVVNSYNEKIKSIAKEKEDDLSKI